MGLFKGNETITKTVKDIYNVIYSMSQNNGSAMITVHDAPKKLNGAMCIYLLGINVASLKPLTTFDIESIMYDENGNQNNGVTLNWNIGTTSHQIALDRYNVKDYFSVNSPFVFNADNVWLEIMNPVNVTFKYETTQKKIPDDIHYIDITIKTDAPPYFSPETTINNQNLLLNAVKEKGYNNIYNIVSLTASNNVDCYKSINVSPDVTWENALCNCFIMTAENGVTDVTVNLKVAVYN